jgi:hypothetical protein
VLHRNGIDTTIPRKMREATTNIRWDKLVDNNLSHRNEHNNHQILIGLFGSRRANGVANLSDKRTRDLEVLAGFNNYIQHLETVSQSQPGNGLKEKDISRAQERLENWKKYPTENKNFLQAKVDEAHTM